MESSLDSQDFESILNDLPIQSIDLWNGSEPMADQPTGWEQSGAENLLQG